VQQNVTAVDAVGATAPVGAPPPGEQLPRTKEVGVYVE
jgi:hypothetical protein